MSHEPQPSLFIPHGGGPCFFMADPSGAWTNMASFLRGLAGTLREKPQAIIVVSGHWETEGFAFTGAATPPLVYDYYGFPPETYTLRYDVPGAPDLARRAADLLCAAGIAGQVDGERGLDHGVFVPMKIAFPEAEIPMIEMSVERGFDPVLHLAAGRALAALRDEGVLIVGSGMSFHNMRAYGDPRAAAPSREFDQWLAEAAEAPAPVRAERLAAWAAAPYGRFAHPREEHLLPLMVAAGASDAPGARIYSELVLGTAISAFRFD
jgi:aromatic ring-opening dioxygenase catalytic subunit (LigB family)